MDFVLMTIWIVVTGIVVIIYPKKGTFIEKLRFKGTLKSFELEICTKQKNDPPSKRNRSSFK